MKNNSFVLHFPLPRPHCGVPLSNGNQGVLIWGESNLCLTVARAGFWDRRAGKPFGAKTNFGEVRALLEANDEAGLRELFAETKAENFPPRPQQIGGGRLEISFPDGLVPVRAELCYEDAHVEITLENASGIRRVLRVWQSVNDELCVLEGDLSGAQIQTRPTWEWVGEKLQQWGYEPPELLQSESGGGWVQRVPDGDALALIWRKEGNELRVGTALGGDAEAAKKQASTLCAPPPQEDQTFWRQYWREVPRVSLPDAELQKFWELALYKQAGMTPSHGVAATLQGAWMEEYQLPPWSNDYHFNINLQLIYYPALMTNRAAHLAPLWEMVKGWLPILRQSGEGFFQQEGALMLPHATDDQCDVVGSFWAGTIDHGCTAWVAQMAWLHYRYTLEVELLCEVAWPLLNGAFEGYWAMHEHRDGKFSLPVSVSPEYRGSQMDAWGRDASFQLAAWHAVAQALPQAAVAMGEPIDPRWQEVSEKLPPYVMVGNQIGLWDGLILEESHRHHSHLAGVWPFMSFDPLAEQHRDAVGRSMEHWTKLGAGQWAGWSLPWAAILCARLELPDAALSWLKWLDNFANVGYATRHNADFSGASVFNNGEYWYRMEGRAENEIMQMDATMGFLIAVCELLVQNRKNEQGQNVIHVLPRLPRRWRELDFDDVRCEDAFRIGATVKDARVQEIRVTSERSALLRLAQPDGALLERLMEAGEQCTLRF